MSGDNEIQNENIIGEVTNTCFYVYSQGKGAAKSFKYTPYTLIFTDNFLLGDHLPAPDEFTDDGLSVLSQDKATKYGTLRDFLSNGKIPNKGLGTVSSGNFNNLDKKLAYKDIKKITLGSIPGAEVNVFTKANDADLTKGPYSLNCSCLSIDMGLFYGYVPKFILSSSITNDVKLLLAKTSIANKVK